MKTYYLATLIQIPVVCRATTALGKRTFLDLASNFEKENPFFTQTSVARRYIFKPKIKILINFGGPWNEKKMVYSLATWNR
jgi:hypothetical protein